MSTTAVVLARSNDGVPFRIESLSIGGARLAGPLTLNNDEPVQILFELDGHPLDVRGEVIRVVDRTLDRDIVLVRFVDLADHARELIREMVRRTLAAADGDR